MCMCMRERVCVERRERLDRCVCVLEKREIRQVCVCVLEKREIRQVCVCVREERLDRGVCVSRVHAAACFYVLYFVYGMLYFSLSMSSYE